MDHTRGDFFIPDSAINTITKPAEAGPRDEQLIAPLAKERWVNISVRYDEFWKFMYHYLLPTLTALQEKHLIASFYYRVVFPDKEIIQLVYKVSPYNLERHVKPILFKSLDRYYNGHYPDLAEVRVTDAILTQKDLYEMFDLDDFKLLGLEEYYVDEMAYVIGRQAAKVLLDLAAKSAAISLDRFREAGEGNWTLEDSIEKSLSLHCAVLRIFITDQTEIYHFLSWATASMFDNIRKLNDVVDLLEWKFNTLKGMEANFEGCKESFCGYMNYVLECLASQTTFEEAWLNEWVTDCYKCKGALDTLKKEGKMLSAETVSNDETVFHDIDDDTFKNWQITFSILRMVNRQIGVSLNYFLEVDLFYSMKQSFKTFLTPITVDNNA